MSLPGRKGPFEASGGSLQGNANSNALQGQMFTYLSPPLPITYSHGFDHSGPHQTENIIYGSPSPLPSITNSFSYSQRGPNFGNGFNSGPPHSSSVFQAGLPLLPNGIYSSAPRPNQTLQTPQFDNLPLSPARDPSASFRSSTPTTSNISLPPVNFQCPSNWMYIPTAQNTGFAVSGSNALPIHTSPMSGDINNRHQRTISKETWSSLQPRQGGGTQSEIGTWDGKLKNEKSGSYGPFDTGSQEAEQSCQGQCGKCGKDMFLSSVDTPSTPSSSSVTSTTSPSSSSMPSGDRKDRVWRRKMDAEIQDMMMRLATVEGLVTDGFHGFSTSIHGKNIKISVGIDNPDFTFSMEELELKRHVAAAVKKALVPVLGPLNSMSGSKKSESKDCGVWTRDKVPKQNNKHCGWDSDTKNSVADCCEEAAPKEQCFTLQGTVPGNWVSHDAATHTIDVPPARPGWNNPGAGKSNIGSLWHNSRNESQFMSAVQPGVVRIAGFADDTSDNTGSWNRQSGAAGWGGNVVSTSFSTTSRHPSKNKSSSGRDGKPAELGREESSSGKVWDSDWGLAPRVSAGNEHGILYSEESSVEDHAAWRVPCEPTETTATSVNTAWAASEPPNIKRNMMAGHDSGWGTFGECKDGVGGLKKAYPWA